MSGYLDIVVLLMVVVLIFIRLRDVLGTRPQNQPDKIKIISREEFEQVYSKIREKQAGSDIGIVESKAPEEMSETDKALALIPDFSQSDFCLKCEKVFEMVLKAFASADEKTLKMLVSKKLFAKFKEILQQRQADGITAETDLIRLNELSIEHASLSSKGIAQIVVKFVSEQVNLLKNAAGEIIEGDENFVQKITDMWTFERDIHSNSPVWFLVSTKKGNA